MEQEAARRLLTGTALDAVADDEVAGTGLDLADVPRPAGQAVVAVVSAGEREAGTVALPLEQLGRGRRPQRKAPWMSLCSTPATLTVLWESVLRLVRRRGPAAYW